MRFLSNILILTACLLPIHTAFAEAEAESHEQFGQNLQTPYYEALYDDAYGSEYDSIYDSSDESENSVDAAPVQTENEYGDSDFVQSQNVEIPEVSAPAESASERTEFVTIDESSERLVSEQVFVEREPKKERRHHPHYFMSFGVFGNFHFDSFMGKETSYTNIFGGLSGSLRFGLIGQDFHWAIEQVFGHLWGLRIDNGSQNMTRYDGATLVEASIVRAVSRRLSGVFSFGAGFFYNMPHTGQTAAYGDYLAVDDKGTNLAVGAKLSAAIVYDISQFISIGADLAYIVGLDIGSYIEGEFADRNGNYSNSDSVFLEMLQPGIFCLVKF